VSVTAVVTDSAAATAGAALTNTATLQVFDPADPATELTDPANPLTATQTVEIVEPVLVLDKTAPVAAGPGDTVAYAVEVAHAPTSTADAFDLVIADLIDDPDLAFDSGSVVVTGVTGAVVSETATGFEVAIPALTLGEVATIAYTATLSPTAPEAESFPNTATVDFDSLAGPGGRPDTAGDDARVSTVPAIDKTLVDTSIDETFGADLALGEVAGFEITLVLPEVLNEDVVLVDTLPDGLTPLSLTVLSVGSQLSAAGAVADLAMPDVVIAGQTVTVDFGAIANLADDGVDAGDAIVLRLEAVVDADPAANADGTVLTNEAVLSLTAGTADFTVEDTAGVAVIQPELSLAKTANPVAEVDAGDVVDFEIVVTNSGTAPAFDIQIEDLLADAGLTLVSGSVAASDGSDASAVTNPDGTTGFRLDAPVLAAGATLTITYQAVVTDAAAFDSQVENTARVAGFDTNPAEPGDPGFVAEASFAPDPDDPDDPLVDSAVVATVGVDLDKTVAETSAAATGSGAFDPGLEDLSVGETVRYELDVAVPEGSGILRLTDTLPAGLEAVSASVDAFAAGITATGLAVGDDEGAAGIAIAADGGSVVFDFATVVSTGVDDAPGAGDLRTITVSVTAVVTDSAAATAGAALTNTATL
ncbi:MAG: isopeptide-forming domain-containing fimbrial protein, partial [Pseudomonadota bacterium]